LRSKEEETGGEVERFMLEKLPVIGMLPDII
jgi:hypothetical protein